MQNPPYDQKIGILQLMHCHKHSKDLKVERLIDHLFWRNTFIMDTSSDMEKADQHGFDLSF
jgi:hypothetical protein